MEMNIFLLSTISLIFLNGISSCQNDVKTNEDDKIKPLYESKPQLSNEESENKKRRDDALKSINENIEILDYRTFVDENFESFCKMKIKNTGKRVITSVLVGNINNVSDAIIIKRKVKPNQVTTYSVPGCDEKTSIFNRQKFIVGIRFSDGYSITY